MSIYSEKNYSLSRALENIGAGFWSMYKDALKTYAEDRSRTDILEQIHAEWDSKYNCSPFGTNIRIDWAIKGIYDHGDWDAADSETVPDYRANQEHAANVALDPRLRYPAEYRCDNGIYVRSISELCIANWFYSNNIRFEYEREVVFPSATARAHCDFYLPDEDVYIEFWGMSSNDDYKKYKEWKQPLYKANGYKLISLDADDLKNLRDRFTSALTRI